MYIVYKLVDLLYQIEGNCLSLYNHFTASIYNLYNNIKFTHKDTLCVYMLDDNRLLRYYATLFTTLFFPNLQSCFMKGQDNKFRPF